MTEREVKGVVVLGSTGSIGVSTLDVIARHPDRFRVVALTANRDVASMFAQLQQFEPEYAVMGSEQAAAELRAQVQQAGLRTEVMSGEADMCAVAALDQAAIVMAAIVGAAGLLPTLAAVRAGKRVLLANKEALVMSGQLFMDAVRRHDAELLPIDSEHNAIYQCLPHQRYPDGQYLEESGVERILLTGSGGPFRTLPIEQLPQVTPAQACAHPNWSMGQKISVDSATMMNKGLEFIEACWLFAATAEQVDIVIHPKSVVHSMVAYVDGSVLAQLGHPDMRTPIAYGLGWPERIASGLPILDLVAQGALEFEPPDEARFPCLTLARRAWQAGQTASVTLNAANEVAVNAFLAQQIRYTDIAAVIDKTLEHASLYEPSSLDVILEADRESRALAKQFLSERN